MKRNLKLFKTVLKFVAVVFSRYFLFFSKDVFSVMFFIKQRFFPDKTRCCCGHDRMVVGFTTTCAISAYDH